MTEIPLSTQLYGFVDDLERSLDFDLGVTFDCDNIILCGVGGSAVSGDVSADCCYAESRVPIVLVKYPDLPSWAGERTLAVISSYSGNTAETLEMHRQARERGCTIVSVTSGGILEERSRAVGEILVKLPKNMQPRHAIGYMIGYTLAVIKAAGGPDLSDRICSFIPDLRDFRDSNVLEEGCLARELADRLMDRTPVVCSTPGMRSVAFRWKTQFNENAKYVAFCDSEPAFGRESLGAWLDGVTGRCLLIMLIDPFSEGRMGCDADSLADAGREFVKIRLDGASTLENMFRAIILGDYVSMYMAEARGIDPAAVIPVMQMKAKLKTVLNRCQQSLFRISENSSENDSDLVLAVSASLDSE